jgi:hypothetical protein
VIRAPTLSLLPVLAVVAACAPAPPPPGIGLEEPIERVGAEPRGARAGGGEAGGQFNLFISPAGKPYRGKPGEPYPSAVWFAEADKDHDGRLSREEFRADTEAFFRELDTDHNGVVDGFEIQAYEQSVPEILPRIGRLAAGEGQDLNLGVPEDRRQGRSRLGGGAPRGGGRGAPQQEGAGLFTFIDQPEPVTAADTDFDGKISLKEADAAGDRRFDILDKDKDGYLTMAELPKTPVQAFAERRAQQRERRGGGRKRPPMP